MFYNITLIYILCAEFNVRISKFLYSYYSTYDGKKVTTAKKGYGWVPGLPDHRDKMYGAVCNVPGALPSKVDLKGIKYCSKSPSA